MTRYVVMGRDDSDVQVARIVESECGDDALEAGTTQTFVPTMVWTPDDLREFADQADFGEPDVVAVAAEEDDESN